MSMLNLFFARKSPQTQNLVIDLRLFECGHTKLGQKPDDRDFFSAALKKSETYDLKREGFEVGTEHGILDYVFVKIAAYRGSFTWNGAGISLDASITRDHLVSKFGHPYWIDETDDDLLHFYEFEGGQIELQFEFIARKKLGFITLMNSGILSTAEQRRRYGVTKPWPP